MKDSQYRCLSIVLCTIFLFFFQTHYVSAACLDNDGDGVTTCDYDCNDNDPTVYPDAPEICDGKDNDCNYRLPTNERDSDLDTYRPCSGDCNDYNANINPGITEINCNGLDDDCNPATFDCSGTDNDNDGSLTPDDCNDSNNTVYPGATELCDGLDNDCDSVIPTNESDSDLDSVRICDGDCDDTNNTVYPGNLEVCDGLDNDCDGQLPANELDSDADGFLVCEECDDTDPNVNPLAAEGPFGDPSCTDTKDNDCDGLIDDLDENCFEPCLDSDGDGYGTNGVIACLNGTAIDCDDTNAAVNPGASEGPQGNPTCSDNLDNDCDGLVDGNDPVCNTFCADNDGDGYGSNDHPDCPNSGYDCDDSNSNTFPAATEICDGIDNDCDYRLPADERDSDADGVPLCAGDCNDYDGTSFPGNTEICGDSKDNDCNGAIDETCPPECGTVSNPQDPPHLGTLLNPDNTIHPDNSALRCGKCHSGNTADPIRYACQRCHADPNDTSDPLNGTFVVQYPDPWPYGFGSAPIVVTHGISAVGNRYGNWEVDCVTCHNPHTQEQNHVFGTTYGKLVKRSICFDNPVTGISTQENVQLISATGLGSFADGPPHNENICETCHSQTNHHQNDGTAPGGQSHYDEEKCTDCHRHSDGFAPTGGEAQPPHNTDFFNANCDFCHLKDAAEKVRFSIPIPSEECMKCHGTRKPHTSTVSGTGKYTYDVGCVDCHDPMFEVGGNIKAVRQTTAQSVISGSSIVFTSDSGPGSFADGPPHNENICETCHTLTDHHRSDGSALLHNDGTDKSGSNCTDCHNHDNSWLP